MNASAEHSATSTTTNTTDQKKTLWMGELETWMDEHYLRGVWWQFTKQQVNVKVIRDKYTGISSGYCFIEFVDHSEAVKALELNNTPIPGTMTKLTLNWATGGISGVFRYSRTKQSGVPQIGPEYSVFVGDLAGSVTDEMLLELFQNYYSSIRSAKVVFDLNTGLSKGYGFVRFGDEAEQQNALVQMKGVVCGSRPIRVSIATPKNRLNQHPQIPHHPAFPINYDPNNTTVFVGGLSPKVTEEELQKQFEKFGEISYVKIPAKMGCGFVSFVYRESAEVAIVQMAGQEICNSLINVIGGQAVRLSWGNSQPYYQQQPYYIPTIPIDYYQQPIHPQYSDKVGYGRMAGYGQNQQQNQQQTSSYPEESAELADDSTKFKTL